MARFAVYSDERVKEVTCNVKGAGEVEVLAHFQEFEPEEKWHTAKAIPDSKHLCKYCGEIAEGEYADLLCAECRELFGHALYSEL